MAILVKAPIVGAVSSETTTGTTYTYSNGYGQLSKAGAQVQMGATVTAHVEIQMKIVTVETTQSWFNENKQVFTAEQQSTIQSHLDKNNAASGWNAIFAWGSTSSSQENYFQNASAQHVETQTESQKNVVNSASKLQSQDVMVTGDIAITGVSMLPTQAFIFAQISTINFEDGTTMQVINQSNPLAATASGDTSTVDPKPNQQLKVVPIK